MDLHLPSIPGHKNQPLKSKPDRKTIEASKTSFKEPENSRPKRIFGTVRNANILARTAAQKPAIKPSIGIPRKQPQRARADGPKQLPPSEAARKNSPENPKPKTEQRTLSLQEAAAEKTPVAGPRTPFDSPSVRTRTITTGSPYQSAKTCSKCRFDRFETSSYWLAQIGLAESVGKHFVSATFFRLAAESKAEPFLKLRVELKRYLARNGGLAEQSEWKEVCFSYGLLKNESETESFDSATGELGLPQNQAIKAELNQEETEDGERHVVCEI